MVTRNGGGFTLVELLVVLALLGLTIGVILLFFDYGNRSWNRAVGEARVVQEARIFINQLDREIRQARVATSGGSPVTVTDGGNQLDIYSDVTGDAKPELIRYRLVNGRLERGVSMPQGSAFPYTYAAPTAYQTIVTTVVNGPGDILFSLESASPPRLAVFVNLLVNDAAAPLSRPLAVQALMTVRSRGDAA
ncbi:MAG: prepilin-type N-terminal cleavage/methylation domain-containing protein [Bacillota bacterium]